MSEYKKKTVILGVTGGIAIYKSCYLCSYLVKRGIDVIVVMTKNATEFVAPLTFETLTNNRVYVDVFDRDFSFDVEHVALAKRADIFVVAPATANFIAKARYGLADDMLSTTYLAYQGKKVLVPAMNTGMYSDTSTQMNIQALREKGVEVLETLEGRLACGDVGLGKMQEPEIVGELIMNYLRPKRDFEGKNVLVTCGGTIEKIDKVRYMSNYSSGKMGVALATNAAERGAKVTLVYGNVSVPIPKMFKNIMVESTQEMYDRVLEQVENQDIIIKAAAPCDFKVKKVFDGKIKDKNLTIEFVANPDIAKAVGKIKGKRKLVIFSAETDNLIENAKAKLIAKNADIVVANDVTEFGAGFQLDTNIVTIINQKGEQFKTEKLPKDEIANIILDKVLELK
ncbi:MAG: bifunctional phosphopantothenoylcysteine decarboxylase/phosphopantothenate--cysteine ligase CoaBC [Clostridia bacterium]